MLGHQFSVLSSSVERSSGVLVKLKQLFCPTASPLTPLTPLRLHTAQAVLLCLSTFLKCPLCRACFQTEDQVNTQNQSAYL